MRIIHESLRQNPRKFLFVQDNGEPYRRRNSFTKFSNRVLERIFGRNFTVSMIRHSFISEGIDFNKSPPGQLFDIAKNMHHSVAMQQLYRRHVDSDVPPPPPTSYTVQMVDTPHVPEAPPIPAKSKPLKTIKTSKTHAAVAHH
ncbi:hypothetical protein EBT31_09535 [bacterium]|nr:hypothetical protein [bacterium]